MISKKFISRSGVFNHLTSDVNTMDKLYNKLISVSDSTMQKSIESVFTMHGALSSQTQWRILNSTNELMKIEVTNNGVSLCYDLSNGKDAVISACKGNTDNFFVVDEIKIYLDGKLCYFQENGKVKISKDYEVQNKDNWSFTYFLENGKEYYDWTYEFKQKEEK